MTNNAQHIISLKIECFIDIARDGITLLKEHIGLRMNCRERGIVLTNNPIQICIQHTTICNLENK